MSLLRLSPLAIFLVGYAILGVVGTRTKMVFQWPSYMLFGLAAVATLLLLGRRTKGGPGTWCLGSMLLLTAYVIGRAAVSPVSYFARMEIAMVLAAAITYLLFSVCLVRSRYRLVFVGLLLALCVGNLFVSLYQVMRDPTYMVLPGYWRMRPEGAGGFYDNHNHLGGFLLVVVSFVTTLALFGKMGPKMRVVVIFLTPVSMAGLALTASRGAFLSLGFGLLVLLALGLFLAKRLYEYEFKKIAIIVGILLVMAVVPVSIIGMKALDARAGVDTQRDDRVEGLTMGSSVRLVNWSLAVDQWSEFPVFGQGARMYDVYSVQHWPGSMNWVHGDPEFAHNDYLQMLGEYGAFGFGLILLFIFTHVAAGIRYLLWYRREGFDEHRSRTNNSLALCFGALVVLAGYAVHSVFDFNLHLPANLVPVAFAFAVLASPAARSSGRRGAPRVLLGAARVALPACGLFLLVTGYSNARGEWHLERARQVDIADYAEVIARLDQSIAADSSNHYAHQLYGTALMLFGFDFDIAPVRAGFMNRAAIRFERALEINPYDIFSIVGLGRCLDEIGEHERAEAQFVRATELGPWRREAHLRYGFHHIDRGRELISTDLVSAIERFKLGKEEMEKCRRSNERIQPGSVEIEALKNAGRYLSIAYEEHGNRLVDTAGILRLDERFEDERAYLLSAHEYYSDAIREAPDRAGEGSSLKAAMGRLTMRLAELGITP